MVARVQSLFFFFEFFVYCVEALKPILRITYCEVRCVGLGWIGKWLISVVSETCTISFGLG